MANLQVQVNFQENGREGFLFFMVDINIPGEQRQQPNVCEMCRSTVTVVTFDSKIRRCFSLYTQCIWRKVANCDLTTEFRENEDFHRLVRRAAILLVAPGHHVENVQFKAALVMRFKDYWYETQTQVEEHLEMWNHFDHDAKEHQMQLRNSATSLTKCADVHIQTSLCLQNCFKTGCI